jgi:hypothetical protein
MPPSLRGSVRKGALLLLLLIEPSVWSSPFACALQDLVFRVQSGTARQK